MVDEKKPGKSSFAILGFGAGVITVLLALLAIRGC